MKAARLAPLVLVVACAPDEEAIGTTEWSTPLEFSVFAVGVAGPAGHVAIRTETGIQLFAPDGQSAWSAPCGEDCFAPGATMALDHNGDVFVTEVHVEQEEIEVRKLAHADGSLAWIRTFPGERLSPGALVDGSSDVWIVVVAAGPTDLGGGPVGGADREARWARLDGDGQHLASGALGFVVGPCAAAWPDHPGVVLSGPGCMGAIAVDRDGAIEWRDDSSDIVSFVLGAGGEVTMVSIAGGSDELIRVDGDHREHWRVRLGAWGINELTPLADGGLIATQFDGLGSTSDVTYLQRVTPDGELSDREYFVDGVTLVEGPVAERYRMLVPGKAGTVLVGRRLP
jgi:hypothetical protein